ncbi:MAG: HlyD family efflux transporter periplasmic adaptor subunit [Nannocystaceae bacterium]|nr:HlyD family efflux transporter periplasmic adaptor subunit [Nannocystaceae bacterium]
MGSDQAAAQRPAAYLLRVRHRGARAADVVVDRPRVIVGREGADLVLHDDHVCRAHAELVFKDGVVGVRDLGSVRGIWIDGRRVPRAILRPGRPVTMGRTRLELVEVGVARSTAGDDDAQTRMVLDPRAALADVLAAPGGAGPAALRPSPAGVGILDVVADERAPSPVAVVAPPPRPRELPAQRAGARAPAAGPAAVAGPAVVVIAGATAQRAAWLDRALAGLPCTAAGTASEVVARTSGAGRAVVVLAGPVPGAEPRALFDRLAAMLPADALAIVAADAAIPDDARIFYRVPPGLEPTDLRRVVAGALQPRGGLAAVVPMTETRAWTHKQIFDVCAAVGLHAEPTSAALAVEQGIAQLVPSARVACLYFDAHTGELWRGCGEEGGEGTASVGIAGFVARTGQPVCVPCVGRDPRYVARLDDPRGNGHEALLAVPVPGPQRELHAVLVAVREPTQGGFDARACQALSQLGLELGGVLHRVSRAAEAQGALERAQQPAALRLYRAEAVQAVRLRGEQGEVIRVSGAWTRAMYWSLVAMLIAVIVGVCVGEVSQYSTGPAVVRQHGRSDVAALGAGAVKSIDVEPGARVQAGQILVRLSDGVERASWASTRADYETQLRARLADPTDEAAGAQLTALRRALEASVAALETRVIRAPHDGVVTDIAVTPGQHVAGGDAVLAVVDRNAPGLELVAFLPGGDRPQLQPGMALRLELGGFDYAWQDLAVGTISEGVVGAEEARRILGPQHADTLPLGGSVVMVRATLPSTTFESDGETYPYHDGMGGTAEVRLRDETLLELLVPALKEL